MQSEDVKRVVRFVGVLVLVLIVFVGIKAVGEIKAFRYIGSDSFSENNSISVSGEGEVFAVADIASFSYSVTESAPTVGAAEEAATTKWNEILTYLKGQGVEERDIRMTGYTVTPEYAAQNSNVWVPVEQRDITGYRVTQSAQVKVRDTGKTGEILGAVGEMGVRNLSNISFTIDDESELYAEARKKAIADAKEKATALAASLGVRLGSVVGFYENNMQPYYGYDMVARTEALMNDGMGGAITPDIPMGENRTVVNVEVIYQIK